MSRGGGGVQAYRILDDLTWSVLYGLGSGICFIASSVMSFLLIKQKRQMQALLSCEVLSPTELLERVSSKYSNQLVTLQQQGHSAVSISGNFLVKGEVDSGYVIPSIDGKSNLVYTKVSIDKLYMRQGMDRKKNVIQRQNELEDIRFLDFFSLSDRQQVQQQQQAAKLKDSKKSKLLTLASSNDVTEFEQTHSACEVWDYGNFTRVDGALRQVAFVEKLNEAIQANSRIHPNALILVGLSQSQVGIKVGDSILVYAGGLVYDLKKQILRIYAPSFLSKTKNDIMCVVEKNYQLKLIVNWVLVAATIYYGYRAVEAIISHRQEEQARRRRR